MRADIDRFNQAGATVVAIAPDSAEGVARFVRDKDFPFRLLADPEHSAFDAYDVLNKLLSLGQEVVPVVVVFEVAVPRSRPAGW